MNLLITKKKSELTTPESINFTELVRNSNTTLSLTCQSDMIELLNTEFTEKQQQWYIANLYLYLNYDSSIDYPINLENVYKMIGFANKGNAMKTIKSNFTPNEDYKTVIFPREKNPSNKDLGGRPTEDIMLNIDCFKSLCMLAKTPQGKEIRKYYVKLESINNKMIKKQIEENTTKLLEQQQLIIEEKDKELKRTQKQLEKKTKLKVKKWYDSEPGDTIYAVKNDNSIKIGKSKLIKTRETHYVNDMFYIKKCYNCDLVEKVLHHILDKYRIEKDKEYFDISDTLAIYIIDIVCDFLDKFINYSEELEKSNIKENLENSLQVIKELSKEQKTQLETDIDINTLLPLTKIEGPPIVYNIDPTNFNKFIEEFCELNDEYYTTKYDLVNAYRLWIKDDVNRDKQKVFFNYMNSKFKYKDQFLSDYGSRFQIYLGIRPKILEFIPTDITNLEKYEEFFIEKCHVNYSFKIKYSDFIENYKKWLNDKYPNYIFTKTHDIDIRSYLNKKFLFSKINVDCGRNGKGVVGCWGFQFKTVALPSYALQCRRKKEVLLIDCSNNNIVNTFSSATETTEKLKIDPRKISDYIRFEKPFDYNNKKIVLKYKV